MTNEEIYLYKKAQNGGKSDFREVTINHAVVLSAQQLTEVGTVTKVDE